MPHQSSLQWTRFLCWVLPWNPNNGGFCRVTRLSKRPRPVRLVYEVIGKRVNPYPWRVRVILVFSAGSHLSCIRQPLPRPFDQPINRESRVGVEEDQQFHEKHESHSLGFSLIGFPLSKIEYNFEGNEFKVLLSLKYKLKCNFSCILQLFNPLNTV